MSESMERAARNFQAAVDQLERIYNWWQQEMDRQRMSVGIVSDQPQEYVVLSNTDENLLAEQVRVHLALGWRLQGGVSLVSTDLTSIVICAQAMVKP